MLIEEQGFPELYCGRHGIWMQNNGHYISSSRNNLSIPFPFPCISKQRGPSPTISFKHLPLITFPSFPCYPNTVGQCFVDKQRFKISHSSGYVINKRVRD
jgi:hypothetical protein